LSRALRVASKAVVQFNREESVDDALVVGGGESPDPRQ
jgi:hypothetical protein